MIESYLLDIATLAKYIISIIGILGLFIVVIGLIKDRRELVTRGGYLIILALVLGICGYFIYKATLDRADDMIYKHIETSDYNNY